MSIALRKVEELTEETEVRYFVLDGRHYSPNGVVPVVVSEISARHKTPFYSVDVVERADGELRLTEIGDDQISDRKNWDAKVF